ncbi:hypothetical protein Ahy_A06g029365 [Arachis hypogaea]|uniref:Uncharacterized protein n=1 Tax=Arachis hypogaea TaxID=3818 RepID=A0A445CT90_ARAHY|nr:hypothetical protein Ahy_A06g029365 [Arachis hypogaea]
MSFLLPITINKVSPVHISSIFSVDTRHKWNWGGHILNFLIKGISEHILKKEKSVNGCLYALIIVYFHESTHKNKPVDTIPGPPWLQHWTKELLLERIKAEIKGHMGYMISRMRVFSGGQPLTNKDDEIEAPYVNIAGQHTRDKAIQESEVIRLSKPSAALLSPYCKLGSKDIDSE